MKPTFEQYPTRPQAAHVKVPSFPHGTYDSESIAHGSILSGVTDFGLALARRCREYAAAIPALSRTACSFALFCGFSSCGSGSALVEPT